MIGRADWGARPDPVDGTLITATSDVAIRALRLDHGTVVASGHGDSRELDATEQRARTKAVRRASQKILEQTAFVGQLMNNWEEVPWSEDAYWVPDPGSVPERVGQASTPYRDHAPAL